MNAGALYPKFVGDWLARSDRHPVIAVDSHTGGNPTRIVLSGIDLPEHARTVDTARTFLRENADYWRTRLVHEPRGGGLTCAVLPIPSHEDGCDIGAVILEPGSYPPMCGHCMIGLASVIVELDLLPGIWSRSPHLANFRIRTPAGPVGITARRDGSKFTTVTLTNVASYVVLSAPCEVEGRVLPVELLYGGDYYISVDARKIGLSLDRSNATEIVRLSRVLKDAFTAKPIYDPITGAVLDVYQVLFYEHDQNAPHCAKIVVVAPPGVIDRSPCGTGTSALFAKLVTEGKVKSEETVTTHSIIGSTFTVTAASTKTVGGRVEIAPNLTGRAYINGFLTIAADAEDPLTDGFPPL